jgi:hypothetical protein
VIITFLTKSCLANDNKFVAGFEFGPCIWTQGSLPSAVVADSIEKGNLGLLSIWLKFGYQLKRSAIIVNVGLAGYDGRNTSEDSPDYFVSDIYLNSIESRFDLINAGRLALKSNIGISMTYYHAHPVKAEKPIYNHYDDGPLIGGGAEFKLRDGAIWDHYVEITYKYYFYNKESKSLDIYYRFGQARRKLIFFHIGYFEQKEIFNLYTLTCGIDFYPKKVPFF